MAPTLPPSGRAQIGVRTQLRPEYRRDVTTLRRAHTSDLTAAELRDARALMDAAFDDDFSDHDWEHGLGGVHALIHDETGALLAHGAVVQRRILHDGRSLRIGYVEAVAVRPDRQRQGLGGQIMGALEQVIDAAYELGALSASDDGARLYLSRGWQEWKGAVGTLGPTGVIHMPDEEPPLLWGADLDPAHEILIDWRDGDVY
ncbi:aminoglycoside 2'-N-acetyltransferase [Streptomyces venezuelae]|uniref:Aminoglycoside 2'-N-acetyltransferase n=1 Tax=Streptomyces venezuelae TaxID=54571 RepID=A0A5P2CQK7_STRVZ|nr:aminoglycoside 2'-N-acetyltransferase [Streptomyces venezuelae]